MPITIEKPEFIHERGMREKNEDMLFPWPGKASENDRLFVVCDGVGGSAYGEKASYLACKATADYFSNPEEDPGLLLPFIEKQFTEDITQNPEHGEMATTLVFLNFYQKNAHIGWVGDSRLYHIRNGKVLYQTYDHSLVNHLIETGELTPQEAQYDPRKHILTRAITGDHRPTQMDHVNIENILPGDFFMLFTDGILEGIDEAFIFTHFHAQFSAEKVSHYIRAQCEGKTVDNYSMYLIKITGI